MIGLGHLVKQNLRLTYLNHNPNHISYAKTSRPAAPSRTISRQLVFHCIYDFGGREGCVGKIIGKRLFAFRRPTSSWTSEDVQHLVSHSCVVVSCSSSTILKLTDQHCFCDAKRAARGNRDSELLLM